VKKNNFFKNWVNLAIYFLILASVSSCAKRNLVYLSDLPTTSNLETPIKNYSQPKIQTEDILNITVSSLNAESNVLFNNVLLPSNANSGMTIASKLNEGYLVDKSGAINFPVIGKIMLVGLTKEQATEKLTAEIRAHVKNPIVNIRFVNFKITVIGEVKSPATFTLNTEKVSVLEALGLAGDMTAFGKRENVLIIREDGGIRRTGRINLNNKDVLNSPFYYLQQNDIVYVEPANRAKLAETAQSNRMIPVWTTVIGTAGFVAITIINKD
jgi:polysaccharide export outer membrane protein